MIVHTLGLLLSKQFHALQVIYSIRVRRAETAGGNPGTAKAPIRIVFADSHRFLAIQFEKKNAIFPNGCNKIAWKRDLSMKIDSLPSRIGKITSTESRRWFSISLDLIRHVHRDILA